MSVWPFMSTVGSLYGHNNGFLLMTSGYVSIREPELGGKQTHHQILGLLHVVKKRLNSKNAFITFFICIFFLKTTVNRLLKEKKT